MGNFGLRSEVYLGLSKKLILSSFSTLFFNPFHGQEVKKSTWHMLQTRSTHIYIDPGTINDSTQAVWTIQCVLILISLAIPHLASAGDGHKFTLPIRN